MGNRMPIEKPRSFVLLLLVLSFAMGLGAIICGESSAAAPGEDLLLAYWKEHHRTPQEYVAGKFADKDWVFLGEYHRIKHDVDLVASLIPILHDKTDVRCLAMEFLRHEDTDDANKLITAASFDRRRAIRLLAQGDPGWGYEEYLRIFESAWKSNRRHRSKGDAFRLVGLDPGYDFETVNFSSDPVSLAREDEKRRNGDRLMAEYLESEVLSRNRKALIYMGEAHSTAKFSEYYLDGDGKFQGKERMGNYVYRDPYKNRMFFIKLHAPFGRDSDSNIYPFNGRLDRLMGKFQKDIGFDVEGSPFESMADDNPKPNTITGLKFGQLFDGYVIFKAPVKEFVGVTCMKDWITTPEEYRYFWRHIAVEKEDALWYSRIPFAEYMKTRCQPGSADYGVGFKRRFESMPDIH